MNLPSMYIRSDVAAGAAFVLAISASKAQAHAFGARYDLPLPLNFYLVGAGAAVALSFVVMALIFRAQPEESGTPWADLTVFKPVRALFHPAIVGTLQATAIGLFFLILGAGFFGTKETGTNFAPTFVWIIWWVGFSYLVALVGNLWPVVNPWSILFSWSEKSFAYLCKEQRLGLSLHYPTQLGAWPAVVLFGCFAWFELISESANSPAVLATAIVVYSGITWFGMLAFGRGTWLASGEAFSLAFDVIGRFAPLGGRSLSSAASDSRHRLFLRPYAGALVVTKPCHFSMTAFVMLILSTVTFDGFKETPIWGELLKTVAASPMLHPLIRTIHDMGFNIHQILQTVILVLFPLVFLLVYLFVAWLTKRAAADPRSVTEIAGLFVFSLVPIAIAYHLAHYLSYLVLAGQFIIPLASDPFGFGWDLFGTAAYKIEIGLIGAKFIWYMAVISIVGGHVIAVGVAHFTALEVFEGPKTTLRSQYPLTVLMVGYTVASLWILSQPIVSSEDVSRLHAQDGMVTLVPFEIRERCYVMNKGEEVSYSFYTDNEVKFDIHYHDGLKTHFPITFTGSKISGGKFRAENNRNYCLMWVNQSLSKTTLTYRTSGPK